MKSIHFICRGNVYRSRLAEAYAMSLAKDKGLKLISSSGIEATRALNGDVDPDTVKLLEAEGLEKYLTPKWKQTTQEDIDNHEVIVFMSRTLYEQANKSFNIPQQKVRVWDIKDIDGIYPQIKQEVDELALESKF
ncbi:MAG: hypothetical protein ACR2FM_02400 [Candidatus Saccharimonadales bacterium]